MAYQYNFKGNDKQIRKYKTDRTLSIIFTVLSVLGFLYVAYTIHNTWSNRIITDPYQQPIVNPAIEFFLPFIVLAGIPAALGEHFRKEADIARITMSGKEIAQQSLSGLSDEYKVLSNVSLSNGGKDTTYDTIVLSKYGISVVMTNNRNGKIEGGQRDPIWIQHKVGREGTPYTSNFKNPLRKLYFQRMFLQEFLENNGIPKDVDGFVVMPHAELVACQTREMARNQLDLERKIKGDQVVNLTSQEVDNILHLLEQNNR